MARRALIVLAAWTACGVEPAADVTVRLHHPAEQDLVAAGTTVAVIVEERGGVVARREAPIDSRMIAVPVDPGEGLAVEVQVLDGAGFVTARGRSFPFVFDGVEDRVVDVWIARTGLFGATGTALTGTAPVSAAWATEEPLGTGAWLVTDDGSAWEYVHHEPGADGAPVLHARHHWMRTGALWARLGPERLLAVGGDRAGATVFDLESGAELDTLDVRELDAQRFGAALVGIDAERALLVGGAPAEASPPVASVTAIDFDGTDLSTMTLPPLPAARRDASAVAIDVVEAGARVRRVLVVGGTDASVALRDAILVDPGGEPPVATPPDALPVGRAGAAVAPLATGAVLVAGGTAAGAPLDDAFVLAVTATSLELVSPPIAERLFDARARPAAVAIGPGRVLLAGGMGTGDVPLATAELIDWGTPSDPFGFVRPTGALPAATGRAHAVVLGDRTVLVAGAESIALYTPF